MELQILAHIPDLVGAAVLEYLPRLMETTLGDRVQKSDLNSSSVNYDVVWVFKPREWLERKYEEGLEGVRELFAVENAKI